MEWIYAVPTKKAEKGDAFKRDPDTTFKQTFLLKLLQLP